MAARKRQPIDSKRAVAAGSWMAILAATTLGVGTAAKAVHAEVRLDRAEVDDDRTYRLVVQSYDAAPGSVPGRASRPVGSVQREVSAAELRRGVRIELVELRAAVEDPSTRPMVVAWIEVGKADLELDGRMARPQVGSVYGLTQHGADNDTVTVTLDRTLAA